MPRKGALPVTEETRADVRRLHAQGLGRNAIARELARSPRTVSVICEEAGLTFDRTATAVATQAAAVDARARRLQLIERYHQQIERILDRLDRQTHEVREVSFGKVVSYSVDDLPAQDVRNLMMAIVSANAQAAKLEALDGDPAADAARSMLTNLADGIRRLAGAPEADTGEG